MWQSIKISSQIERKISNEGKDFAATIRDLRATQLKSLKQTEAGWEEVLEKQIASRESKKQRKLRIGSKKASYRKMMESEIIARQARLSLVKEMLALLSKRIASKESESSPSIDEETKQEARSEPQPAQRFRVTRPKKHPLIVSPALDSPVLTPLAQPQRKKSSFFDDPAQKTRKLKNWSSCGRIPPITVTPPSWTRDCTQVFENAEAAVRFHAANTVVSAHKPSTLEG
ncbi:hypothetical protein E8E13_005681 [Curvularia kusanoi]|uniref:Uncharacterized protein n=1 Tax=Curvularia kusanoi TaxID=90978 RepID=A0A9P4TGT3_CURKU|nr:hypothetical protein E8E13_005681 [Curvularia kusanoi]